MTDPVAVPFDAETMELRALSHQIAVFLGLNDDNAIVADHALSVVFGLLSGYLRGNEVLPLNKDLRAVLKAASLRYALMLVKVLRASDRQPEGAAMADLPTFAGWTFPEISVLSRYRIRTA